ncbi:MAG: GntR family transcriptional regulator [Vallitaleaceae bacterium]|nr:GntR family transcriptional regulator [Vallitaleaceae bacterium]
MQDFGYRKIAQDLEHKIHEGSFFANGRLPSERELAIEYEVSRMTARQAVLYLMEKNLVYREKGRGTFIKSPSFEQNNVKSFTETVSGLGYEVSTELLEFCTIFTMEHVSRLLERPLETQYYKIKRLRLGNRIPMALETLYVPKDLILEVEREALCSSFYELLEKSFGVKVKKVSYKMEATLANPSVAKNLQLQKTTALLKVSGITIGMDEQKLFYEESYYRSDLYTYHVDISRKF